jgi:hypothetical protein
MFRTRLPICLAYTMPVPHSGHHVTAIGRPSKVSLTISCRSSCHVEYARCERDRCRE